MQMELKDIHQEMNSTLLAGFKEMEHAAQHTQQQLTDISQGQDEIARQQVHLADALALNIQRLKESALHSLDELKDSQAMAMEETRSSLKGLSEGARRAQLNFEIWRVELDQKNQLLLRGSEDMLRAQEAFVSKQGSILATLDRLFSLYDSILYESRALKMFLFYATSLVFIHVLTSAKQTNGARPVLYSGLCISMAIELYLMKTYGTLLINQQWLQTSCYWIRAVLAAFTALVIALFILTYRDINWRNHQLLLEIHQKLSEPSTHPEGKSINSQQFSFEETNSYDNGPLPEMPCLRPFSLQASSRKQALTSKIIRRVHKFIRGRRRGNRRLLHRRSGVDDDALRVWMTLHGMDTSVLDSDTNSDDSGDDPDYECPAMSCWPALPNQYHSPDRYLLRSQCNERCRRPPPWRTYS